MLIGALDYLSIIVTVIILRQVKVSYPIGRTLHEHLWTIAICVAGAPNDLTDVTLVSDDESYLVMKVLVMNVLVMKMIL